MYGPTGLGGGLVVAMVDIAIGAMVAMAVITAVFVRLAVVVLVLLMVPAALLAVAVALLAVAVALLAVAVEVDDN
jgi:hypothetical protein